MCQATGTTRRIRHLLALALAMPVILPAGAIGNPDAATPHSNNGRQDYRSPTRSVLASSEIPGWPATNAIDGSDSTVWSSTSHNKVSEGIEWLAVDYGRSEPLLGASIAPRPGGACFPVDYRIEYSTNLTSWVTVPGMVFTAQAAPRGVVTLNFSNPVFARALRLYATRLSDDGANHYLQLAEFRALRSELWATPAELRGKKFIGGGLYTTFGEATAVTPRFLAKHQGFFASYPFDGIVLPAVLDPEWVKRQSLPRQPQFLHELAWNALEVPYEAIATNVSDLQAVAWGSASDNFLLLGMAQPQSPARFDPGPQLLGNRYFRFCRHTGSTCVGGALFSPGTTAIARVMGLAALI